jgi:hypothetical protein
MTTNITTQTAEDFQLLEVSITSNRLDPTTYNITPVTTEINIFESIDEFYLTGSIMFVDDNDIFSTVDFKGTERVKLRFKIPDPQAPEIVKHFVVSGVTKTQKTNDFANVILLSIIEDHGYYGELKVFSKVYDGKGETIISSILNDQLYKTLFRRSDYETFRESYQSKFRYLVPYITPFQAIQNILDKMTTKNGLPYYLYSSLNTDNLILSDLETMIARDPINLNRPFTYSQNQSNEPDNPSNIYQIYSIGDTNQEDTLLIGQLGALGAIYSNTDVSTGSTSETKYNVINDLYTTLKYDNIIRSTDDVLIDELFVPERRQNDTSAIPDLVSRRFHQVSGQTFPYDPTIKNWTEETKFESYKLRLFKHSVKQLMLKNAYQLLLPGVQFLTGNVQVSVGNQIDITILKNTGDPRTGVLADPKRSGKFLITTKRHIFKTTPSVHTVVVGCTRISKSNQR